MICFRIIVFISCVDWIYCSSKKHFECGENGKFEYCIDGFSDCVIGCYCYPGYYFDTQTKICEPNEKMIKDAEAKRSQHTNTVDESIVNTTPTPTTTDTIHDWLYDQFYKLLEEKVMSESDSPHSGRRMMPRHQMKSPFNYGGKYYPSKRKGEDSEYDPRDTSDGDGKTGKKFLLIKKRDKKEQLPSFIMLPGMPPMPGMLPPRLPLALPLPPMVPLFPLAPPPQQQYYPHPPFPPFDPHCITTEAAPSTSSTHPPVSTTAAAKTTPKPNLVHRDLARPAVTANPNMEALYYKKQNSFPEHSQFEDSGDMLRKQPNWMLGNSKVTPGYNYGQPQTQHNCVDFIQKLINSGNKKSQVVAPRIPGLLGKQIYPVTPQPYQNHNSQPNSIYTELGKQIANLIKNIDNQDRQIDIEIGQAKELDPVSAGNLWDRNIRSVPSIMNSKETLINLENNVKEMANNLQPPNLTELENIVGSISNNDDSNKQLLEKLKLKLETLSSQSCDKNPTSNTKIKEPLNNNYRYIPENMSFNTAMVKNMSLKPSNMERVPLIDPGDFNFPFSMSNDPAKTQNNLNYLNQNNEIKPVNNVPVKPFEFLPNIQHSFELFKSVGFLDNFSPKKLMMNKQYTALLPSSNTLKVFDKFN